MKNLATAFIIFASLVLLPLVVFADCRAAQEVCEDANRAYAKCVTDNPLTGAAVCSPLFNAKMSVCSQADFSCRKGMNSQLLFSNSEDREKHDDAMKKATDIMMRIDDAKVK